MDILKVINNNMVRSINENSQEVILLGKGLGFKKKPGDKIPDEIIEKVYLLQDKGQENELIDLLSEIDFEYIQLVNQIIEMTEKYLKKTLSNSIYISLTDHINIAIQRYRENMIFENPLHGEIKKFYPIEYRISVKAIELINKKLSILLPIEEASLIAMHILNAESDSSYFRSTTTMTKMIRDILKVIETTLQVEFDVESISYERFMTHLKFFSLRLLNGEKPKSVDIKLFELITTEYKEAFQGALAVNNYLINNYDKDLHDSELMYLTMHIEVFLNKNK